MEDNRNPFKSDLKDTFTNSITQNIKSFIESFNKRLNILAVITCILTIIILIILLLISIFFPNKDVYFSIIQYVSIFIFFFILLSYYMLYKTRMDVVYKKNTMNMNSVLSDNE